MANALLFVKTEASDAAGALILLVSAGALGTEGYAPSPP